jgi:AraC-like DNA-binding protein
MTTLLREFFNLIEGTFRFEYQSGASTRVGHPYTTGWRELPALLAAQIHFTASVEFKAGRTRRIEPGQTLSISPGLAHRITKVSRPVAYSHWSHVQCEVFPGIPLFRLIDPPLLTSGSRSRKIGRINRELGEIAAAERSLPALLRRQSLGWELISTLLESVPFNEDRVDLIRNAARLTPVLAYIGENLARPINHVLLARTAGLSPSRFHFLFRSALGSAPYQYVQQMRLKKARELLIRTERTVAEIGREVGHPDPYHFSRTFRRNVGVSPVQYRKQAAFRSF